MSVATKVILTLSIILAYTLVGFATYGYTYQRRECEPIIASFAGVCWSLYWAGRGVRGVASVAEDVFRPSPTTVER